jgi:glutathionylspermidine synthase
MTSENNIREIIQTVKDSEQTKLILKSKMKDFKELNTGAKAELSKKLMVDMVVFEEVVQIMGEGLNEAEIEIECLEAKNEELEKELKLTEEDKERINKLYYN